MQTRRKEALDRLGGAIRHAERVNDEIQALAPDTPRERVDELRGRWNTAKRDAEYWTHQGAALVLERLPSGAVDSPWLSVAGGADYLGISQRQLQRAIARAVRFVR